MNWQYTIDKVPSLILYPAYYRADTVKFENDLSNSNDEIINEFKLLEFILLNSNNENTIKSFMMNNCVVKNTSLCNNNDFIKKFINRKLIYLNHHLTIVKDKKKHMNIEKTDNNIENKNITYFRDYLKLLDKKADEILYKINLYKNFI